MDSQIITVRTPADLLDWIDDVAALQQVSRSALVLQILEDFVREIQERGYMIPPYEGDAILNDLRLGARRRESGNKPMPPSDWGAR